MKFRVEWHFPNGRTGVDILGHFPTKEKDMPKEANGCLVEWDSREMPGTQAGSINYGEYARSTDQGSTISDELQAEYVMLTQQEIAQFVSGATDIHRRGAISTKTFLRVVKDLTGGVQ